MSSWRGTRSTCTSWGLRTSSSHGRTLRVSCVFSPRRTDALGRAHSHPRFIYQLALVDWQSASVRPLWRCARTPYWLLPSLVGDDDARKQRLRSVFRAAVAGDAVFARAVDTDDTRHALDEVAEYDTFRDGFLVLPTLQSMYAFTLSVHLFLLLLVIG